MRRLVLAVVIVTAASGQYLEKYIQLPDTVGGPVEPRVVLYDSEGLRIYYGGSGPTVIGLELPGNRKVARYQTGLVTALCLNSPQRKLYTAASYADSVYIADLSSTSSVSRIKVGEDPRFIVCLPSGDKLYCANEDDSSVSVIDGRGDSLLTTIRVGIFPNGMCASPDGDKVYIGTHGSDEVWVIDTRADSVLAVIPVLRSPRFLAYHPSGKVYSGGAGGIAVICTHGDTVLRTSDGDPVWAGLVYDRAEDRLYWSNSGRVWAMECSNDSVVRNWRLACSPTGIVLDSASRKLFCFHEEEYISIVDLAADTVYTRVVHYAPRGAAVAPDFGRLYVASPGDRAVHVFDTHLDSIIDAVYSEFLVGDVYYSEPSGLLLCAFYGRRHVFALDGQADTVVGKWPFPLFQEETRFFPELNRLMLFVLDWSFDTLGVVTMDVGTGRVVGTYPPGDWCPVDAAHSWLSRKLYVWVYDSGEHRILVLNETGDSLQATIRGGSGSSWPTLNPVDNRIHFCGSDGLYALDCNTNLVHGPRPLGAHPYDMVYNRRDNRVCVANADDRDLYIFDCPSDSLAAVVRVIGYHPTSLAHNTRHNKLYAACNWTNNVNVIDCRTNRLIRSVDVETYPLWMFYEPVGDKLWVHCSDSRSLVVLDGATDGVVATVHLDGYGRRYAWNPDRRCLYLPLNYSNRIAVIDDPLAGIAEGSIIGLERNLPTILRAPELLRLDCRVLDIQGRDVTDRRGRLAPGVYFLKDEGGRLKDEPGGRTAVRKVIVQR